MKEAIYPEIQGNKNIARFIAAMMRYGLDQRMKGAAVPWLGLTEPTICGRKSKRIHEDNPTETEVNQVDRLSALDILVHESDFAGCQFSVDRNRPEFEMPSLWQYDLYHLTEALSEDRGGADKDFANSFFYRQRAVDTLLEHFTTIRSRGGYPQLLWHTFHPSFGDRPYAELRGDLDNQNEPFGQPNIDAKAETEKMCRLLYTASTVSHSYLSVLTRKLDRIAEFCNYLRDALGLTALFRPLHEHDGHWFWWGMESPQNPAGLSPEAYRMLWTGVRRYLERKGVTNLVYVYAPGVVRTYRGNRHDTQPINEEAFKTRYARGMPDPVLIDCMSFTGYLNQTWWDINYTAEDVMAYMLDMIERLRTYYPDKLVGISETGYKYNSGNPNVSGRFAQPMDRIWRNQWLPQLLNAPDSRRPDFLTFWRTSPDDYYLPVREYGIEFSRDVDAIAKSLRTVSFRTPDNYFV